MVNQRLVSANTRQVDIVTMIAINCDSLCTNFGFLKTDTN